MNTVNGRVFNLRRDTPDSRDLSFSDVAQSVQHLRLPRKVDLRDKCPKPTDQLSLGACTGHAGAFARTMLAKDPKLDLSELYLYYMERVIEGKVDEDSGASIRTICKALHKYGICEEKYMPYIIERFKEPPTNAVHENAAKYKINAYRSLHSLLQIKQCLAFRQQPVLVGMEVYESFFDTGQNGEMNINIAGEKHVGNHAVAVVGYEDLYFNILVGYKGYLIIRNSWGENWGDNGYFYMPYAYVNRGHVWDFWTIE